MRFNAFNFAGMKKSTIWVLGIVMGLSFLSLLYLQVSYIEEMVKMRKGQFDESVQRSLVQACRNIELVETKKYQELLSAMLKEQRGERMDEEFIRNRITELRLKKGVSEYQMSMELGQNRSYIQAISSGRSMPSMKQFLNICEYFEITPLQFFDAQENNPQLIKKALDGMRKMSDDDLIMLIGFISRLNTEN